MNWIGLAVVMIGLGINGSSAIAQTTINVDATSGIPISPLIYGINYVWNRVPADEFPAYQTAMNNIAHTTMSRYLGGWGAESYDWTQNDEVGKQAAASAGEAPDDFLNAVLAASFTTPSARAIADSSMIASTVATSVALVSRYGGRVKYWEIGNEWWLQAGAKKHPERREKNLEGYARLLATVAPAIKAVNPSVKIFAMIDWSRPKDVTVLRLLTGPAWSDIDGISIHPYCGTVDATRLCGSLPATVAIIKAMSGKQDIYASEWAVTQGMNANDEGIANADMTVLALQDLALGGVEMAAYWPPVKVLPEIAFVSNNYQTPYPTGIAFGWMATYYQGVALRTSGPVAAVAARDGEKITVIVPSWGAKGTLRIRFNGFTPRHVVSADVIDEANGSAGVSVLPVSIEKSDGSNDIDFQINPGLPGRGEAYEIARVTVQG